MRRLLLLSGGLDSTGVAGLLQPDAALTIDYGQVSAAGEEGAGRSVARHLGIPWNHLRVDCSPVGSGLLAGCEPDPCAPVREWWPFRNQLLATLAAAWALPRGFQSIVLGSVSTDGCHLDGTAQFYAKLDGLIRLQEGGMNVEVPAIGMTTAELLRQVDLESGVLGFTHSCHRSPIACGACPGCAKRAAVLEELGRT
ncbi:MAG: 7-cyano-7-deazaguanine synthase [Solirubrobacteraceae bacterium]